MHAALGFGLIAPALFLNFLEFKFQGSDSLMRHFGFSTFGGLHGPDYFLAIQAWLEKQIPSVADVPNVQERLS
jgi:hypothetical protein